MQESTQFYQNLNDVFSSSKAITFIPAGGYLNFSTRFMKNVLLEQKIIK